MEPEKYTISKETAEKILKALDRFIFGNDGVDDYNNEDVQEAIEALKSEMKSQE